MVGSGYASRQLDLLCQRHKHFKSGEVLFYVMRPCLGIQVRTLSAKKILCFILNVISVQFQVFLVCVFVSRLGLSHAICGTQYMANYSCGVMLGIQTVCCSLLIMVCSLLSRFLRLYR